MLPPWCMMLMAGEAVHIWGSGFIGILCSAQFSIEPKTALLKKISLKEKN